MKDAEKHMNMILRTAPIQLLGEKEGSMQERVTGSGQSSQVLGGCWYEVLWLMWWVEMQFWKTICNNVYLTGSHEDCSELSPFEALQLLFTSRDDGWMLELGKKISNHCIRKALRMWIDFSISLCPNFTLLAFSHTHK